MQNEKRPSQTELKGAGLTTDFNRQESRMIRRPGQMFDGDGDHEDNVESEASDELVESKELRRGARSSGSHADIDADEESIDEAKTELSVGTESDEPLRAQARSEQGLSDERRVQSEMACEGGQKQTQEQTKTAEPTKLPREIDLPTGDKTQQPPKIEAKLKHPPKNTTDKAETQNAERTEEPQSEPAARAKVAEQSGTDHAAERKRQAKNDDDFLGDSKAQTSRWTAGDHLEIPAGRQQKGTGSGGVEAPR